MFARARRRLELPLGLLKADEEPEARGRVLPGGRELVRTSTCANLRARIENLTHGYSESCLNLILERRERRRGAARETCCPAALPNSFRASPLRSCFPLFRSFILYVYNLPTSTSLLRHPVPLVVEPPQSSSRGRRTYKEYVEA